MRRACQGLTTAMALSIAAPAATAQTVDAAMAGWMGSLQQTLSALRVDTRQQALVAEQAVSATTNAQMSLASVIVEQETAIATRDAVARYESMHADPLTGLCAVTDAQAGVSGAEDAASQLNAGFEDFERQWLEEGGDRITTLIDTHLLRRTAFCSEAERALGLCEGPATFGVPVAADSDASPFLLRRSYGTAEVDVGSVFVDTVAPLPTISTAEDAEAGDVSDLVAHAEARRELALVALARSGLTGVLVRGVEAGPGE